VLLARCCGPPPLACPWRGTHPLVPLRMAFTTSLTPRFSCFFFAAFLASCEGAGARAAVGEEGRGSDARGKPQTARHTRHTQGLPAPHLERLLAQLLVCQGAGDHANVFDLLLVRLLHLLGLGLQAARCDAWGAILGARRRHRPQQRAALPAPEPVQAAAGCGAETHAGRRPCGAAACPRPTSACFLSALSFLPMAAPCRVQLPLPAGAHSSSNRATAAAVTRSRGAAYTLVAAVVVAQARTNNREFSLKRRTGRRTCGLLQPQIATVAAPARKPAPDPSKANT